MCCNHLDSRKTEKDDLKFGYVTEFAYLRTKIIHHGKLVR